MIDAYAAHAFWIWLGLAGALLAIEVAVGSGWLLWPSASAAAVGVLALLISPSLPVALFVFAILTIASTLLARRYFPRSAIAGAGDINDNIGRLVGQQGLAAGPFADGRGRVLIDGKEWLAELDGGGALDAEARVTVLGVSDGSRLRVKPVGG